MRYDEVPVMGDGNCLFRAIAEQLDGNENLFCKYRASAVAEMQKNYKVYEEFRDGRNGLLLSPPKQK